MRCAIDQKGKMQLRKVEGRRELNAQQASTRESFVKRGDGGRKQE